MRNKVPFTMSTFKLVPTEMSRSFSAAATKHDLSTLVATKTSSWIFAET